MDADDVLLPHGKKLLILDAHGVVFNNPFLDFLNLVATETGRSPDSVRKLWSDELRMPSWTGRITTQDTLQRLIGRGQQLDDWFQTLETLYQLGPAAPRLRAWSTSASLWLLSNHRSEWLLPRLKRFGLLSQFERILVSDELGKAKPDESIFRELRNEIADRSVLFIDDRQRNVDAAIAAGINAMQAVPSGSWLSGVNSWLEDSIVS